MHSRRWRYPLSDSGPPESANSNQSQDPIHTANMRVYAQNPAGVVVAFDDVRADETVDDLHRRVHAEQLVECALERQRLFIIPPAPRAEQEVSSDQSDQVTLDDGDCTLEAYGVANETTVHVCVRARILGEYVRVLGEQEERTFNSPWSLCMSQDGNDLLYVAERGKVFSRSETSRVSVVRAATGSRVRDLGPIKVSASASDIANLIMHPSGVCLSRDGAELFVADIVNRCVHVVNAANLSVESPDRSAIVTDHERFARLQFQHPHGMCVSLDNQLLFVADCDLSCVFVMRSSDGLLVRVIGTLGVPGNGPGEFKSPDSLCLSPDGELLFVSDSHNNNVQVFRVADGAFLRSLGEFESPMGVCLSPNGEWLYIAEVESGLVQVVRTSDGERERSIDLRDSGCDAVDHYGQMKPTAICLSTNGNLLYVADAENDCVHVFAACQH